MIGNGGEPGYFNVTTSKMIAGGEVLNRNVDSSYYGNTTSTKVNNETDTGASMVGEDRVRVLRVIEYEGPRSAVERTLKKSIKGDVTYGDVTIRAAVIGEFPTILTKGNDEDVGLAPDVLTMEGAR